MKKVIISYLVGGFILVFTVAFSQGNSDCDFDNFMDGCIAANTGGHRLLKMNKISVPGGEDTFVELSIIMSGKTTYLLTACTEGPKMTVTLYDQKRKQIISSYNERKEKYYPSVEYKCKAAGRYYLKYEFEQGSAGCGIGIVGFKR